MFICRGCKRQTQPGEKMHKVPVKKRMKHYDCGSTGWETIEEISVCEECKNVLSEQVIHQGQNESISPLFYGSRKTK